MRSPSSLVCALAITLFSSQPSAAITSTFTTGTDGWTLGDANNPNIFPAGNGTLTWNPAGFINGTENAGGAINVFFAPATYTGNQLGAYDSTISFDLRGASDGVAYSAVYLVGNGQTISNASTFPVPGSFTSFSFNLTEAGWLTYSALNDGGYSGSAVSETQFKLILGNLTHVGIMMDWITGFDSIDLDNVSFGPDSAVPLPAALPLFATGIGLLGVISWRRKRKPMPTGA